MKILAITVGMLVITMLVYDYNALIVRKPQTFLNDYIQCCEDLDVEPTELSTETIKCALDQNERVFYGIRQFIKDDILTYVENDDSFKILKSVQKIFRDCQEKTAQLANSNKKKMDHTFSCITDITSIFYNP